MRPWATDLGEFLAGTVIGLDDDCIGIADFFCNFTGVETAGLVRAFASMRLLLGIETPRPVVVGSFERVGVMVVFTPQRGRVVGEAFLSGRGALYEDSVGVVVARLICELGADIESTDPFLLCTGSVGRTVESDEADVVDSRTESRPSSRSLQSTLAKLPVRFLVTGGRLGLELIVLSIAAGPGD